MHTHAHTHKHRELFLVEPAACLSSGLLWVLAAFPACLSPLPQSAALPFNKRHLNLNKQAQSSLSFNLPLKAINSNNTECIVEILCMCVSVKKRKTNFNQINIHCALCKWVFFFSSAEHLRQHSYVLHVNIVQQQILTKNSNMLCPKKCSVLKCLWIRQKIPRL